jgi:hypothetical protein
MSDVNISLNLTDLFIGSHSPDNVPVDLNAVIRDAVVERAADKLLAQFNVSDRSDMRDRVRAIRDEKIGEHVSAQIEQAMAAPIQRTTRWNEPQGEPTTLRELVREKLEELLNTRPNRTGSFGSKNAAGNLDELLGDAAKDILGKELRQVVQEVRGQLKDSLLEKGLRAAIEAMAPELKSTAKR